MNESLLLLIAAVAIIIVMGAILAAISWFVARRELPLNTSPKRDSPAVLPDAKVVVIDGKSIGSLLGGEIVDPTRVSCMYGTMRNAFIPDDAIYVWRLDNQGVVLVLSHDRNTMIHQRRSTDGLCYYVHVMHAIEQGKSLEGSFFAIADYYEEDKSAPRR